LEVKEVRVGEGRCIVCLNEEEAKRDAAARDAMIRGLEERLATGGTRGLIGNRGYARFLKIKRGSVKINEKAVEADARFDGKFVLRTNTGFPAPEVALAYKELWRVERIFREGKSTLEVHPLFHHRGETSIGHIVASFLAMRLEVDLQIRLEERGINISWPTLMRDLCQVHAVRVELGGRNYLLRTDLRGMANQAFVAAGVRPPSPVTLLN